jgi:Family of unknown function (DUF5372)
VIEVIDPTHPLFGQRFPVLSLSRRPGSPGLVTVAYGDDARLRIPLSVTDRADCLLSRPRTKITPEAISELVTLVEEFTGSWRDKPRLSGRGSQKN